MVGSPDEKVWRIAGIGLTYHNNVGVSLAIVEAAIAQVSNMLVSLKRVIEKAMRYLYEAEALKFAADGRLRLAPLKRLSTRKTSLKPRRLKS